MITNGGLKHLLLQNYLEYDDDVERWINLDVFNITQEDIYAGNRLMNHGIISPIELNTFISYGGVDEECQP